MNTSASQTTTAAMEVDLMPYINALIDRRWWLLGAALASALLAALWSYSRPYMYLSLIHI